MYENFSNMSEATKSEFMYENYIYRLHELADILQTKTRPITRPDSESKAETNKPASTMLEEQLQQAVVHFENVIMAIKI